MLVNELLEGTDLRPGLAVDVDDESGLDSISLRYENKVVARLQR